MADKKITELSVSQTIAADDSVFANIGGSARQVAISLILALLEDVYAPLESPALEGDTNSADTGRYGQQYQNRDNGIPEKCA